MGFRGRYRKEDTFFTLLFLNVIYATFVLEGIIIFLMYHVNGYLI